MSHLRSHLAEMLYAVDRDGARTFVTRNGRRIAAIVPVDEGEAMERAEDEWLSKLVDQARDEQAKSGEPNIPLEAFLAELDDDETVS